MQEENKNEEIQTKEEGKVGEIDLEGYEEGNTKLKLVALFVVAVLVGVAIKAQAAKTIVIGFDDYRVNDFVTEFDLEKKEESEVQQQESQEAGQQVESSAPAPSCGG